MKRRISVVLWCVQINCIIGSCALIPLQSAIKASTGKGKKDKKKNKKATVDDQAEDLDGEVAPAPSKAPVEVTAEDLADEEWGPVKGKKGKKGKGKKGKAAQDDEDEDASQGKKIYYVTLSSNLTTSIIFSPSVRTSRKD